jgi:hypothetical protein
MRAMMLPSMMRQGEPLCCHSSQGPRTFHEPVQPPCITTMPSHRMTCQGAAVSSAAWCPLHRLHAVGVPRCTLHAGKFVDSQGSSSRWGTGRDVGSGIGICGPQRFTVVPVNHKAGRRSKVTCIGRIRSLDCTIQRLRGNRWHGPHCVIYRD